MMQLLSKIVYRIQIKYLNIILLWIRVIRVYDSNTKLDAITAIPAIKPHIAI